MQKIKFEIISAPYAKLMKKKITPRVIAITATILTKRPIS